MADPEHIEILKQGVKAWNKWRKQNPKVKPDLSNAAIFQENGEIHIIEIESDEHREELISELSWSSKGATLPSINLRKTNLNRSILTEANLQEAQLYFANLQDAILSAANLQGAEIYRANLQGAEILLANLQGAALGNANLQGADFAFVVLQRADFSYAIVDGEMCMIGVEVDRDTNFEGVGLDAMRIDPGIKQLLEYNIRRKRWEKRYPWMPKWKRWIIREFWRISDYGISTVQIIKDFFKCALVFAAIYYVSGLLAYYGITKHGFVSELFETAKGQVIGPILAFPRAIYFSIVTMTTLGFGDMYANAKSFLGHFLLTIQVLLGYVFLGALVTRFAVLFTAGGPAAKFTEMTEEDKKALEEIEKAKQSKDEG